MRRALRRADEFLAIDWDSVATFIGLFLLALVILVMAFVGPPLLHEFQHAAAAAADCGATATGGC